MDTNKSDAISTRKIKNLTTDTILLVMIHKPIRESEDWTCKFTIDSTSYKAYGIDSFQSLIMAIEGIRVNLKKIPDELEWVEESTFLGFPMFVPMYLPSDEIDILEKKLSNDVDENTKRYKM